MIKKIDFINNNKKYLNYYYKYKSYIIENIDYIY
jgi:hypothetical protein